MNRRILIGILVVLMGLVLAGTVQFLKFTPSTSSGSKEQIASNQANKGEAESIELEKVGQKTSQSTTGGQSQQVEIGTAVGQQAPTFSLTDIEGNKFSLNDFKGRPLILFFAAAWCPSCIPETETLARIESEYGPRVQVIWIDVDPKRDSVADLRKLGSEHGHKNFIYALDRPDNKVALKFKVRALETTYILNGQRIISYKDFGPTGYKTYKRKLAKAFGD